MKEIVENNKLIAEFMGWKFNKSRKVYHIPQSNGFPFKGKIEDLKYHSSWDWLMPVVEKIERLKYSVRMCAEPWFDDEAGVDRSRTQNICIISNWSYQIVINSAGLGYAKNKGKMHSVHGAVVEFIKWYNNENKQTRK